MDKNNEKPLMQDAVETWQEGARIVRSRAEAIAYWIGEKIGLVSAKEESGRSGAGAVNMDRNDHGGKSYGTHQLSSRAGTLQRFLDCTKYGEQFKGLTMGSPQFDAKWKETARTDPDFGKTQHDFIAKTHYGVQMNELAKDGIDLSCRSRAVQEMIFSVAVQHGPGTDVIKSALKGRDYCKMSDAEIISTVMDHKAAHVNEHFRSSGPKKRASISNRIQREKTALLAMEKNGGVSLVNANDLTKGGNMNMGVIAKAGTGLLNPVSAVTEVTFDAVSQKFHKSTEELGQMFLGMKSGKVNALNEASVKAGAGKVGVWDTIKNAAKDVTAKLPEIAKGVGKTVAAATSPLAYLVMELIALLKKHFENSNTNTGAWIKTERTN